MPSWDHFVDAVNDYAFVKSLTDADEQRGERSMRRRVAAVAWIPGLLLVLLLGAWSRSGVVVIAGFVVLIACLLIYAERPGFLRRR